ncbi:Yip1 family protein [Lysinibacillus piscis]|uniref:Yip1 domain-containing protein n=1 Tax=Lysinibacillus piscis TaxID=2518931 RepID=A0ABQ5NEW3_9BACI|nr:Yip1 family protein [Lysinibacillus sp. KH24]GLC86936.1 hypothetical protein LYSBPC_00630 [Lysinibacillus sp. KH24]
MTMYDDKPQERRALNPFLSVWLHPKQTARYIIDEKSMGYAIFILSIGFIGSSLSGLIDSDILMDMPLWLLIVLLLVLGPIIGLISISISALAIWLFGKLLKGTATYTQLFKALSLTAIPFILLIPFYGLWLVTAPDSLMNISFTGEIPWIFWPTILVTVVSSIWSFVISVGIVAEAHQFSNWKGFFTLLIPSIVLGILFFVLVVIIMIIMLIVVSGMML